MYTFFLQKWFIDTSLGLPSGVGLYTLLGQPSSQTAVLDDLQGLCICKVLVVFSSLWNEMKQKLELVFVKYYAPNICLSPNMTVFAVS